MSTLRYEDIGRLQIPVDDSLRVGSIKTLGDLNGNIENLIRLEWCPQNMLLRFCFNAPKLPAESELIIGG